MRQALFIIAEDFMITKHKQRNLSTLRYGCCFKADLVAVGCLIVLGFSAVVGTSANAQVPEFFPAGNPPPVVGTMSGPSEVALAKHLR